MRLDDRVDGAAESRINKLPRVGHQDFAKKAYLLSGMLLPSYSRIVVREASTRSLIDLATTALAVERFRHQRGQFPTTLAELTPEFLEMVPRDPFDGAPIRYRVLAKGYVVYSVDVDGHDDGGREPPERKKSTDTASYDLTFIVERRPSSIVEGGQLQQPSRRGRRGNLHCGYRLSSHSFGITRMRV